jgi:hypothetical protein
MPAVTRVEEWTREDTGVGAAIAAGSHLEKGIWALFVNAAMTIKTAPRGPSIPAPNPQAQVERLPAPNIIVSLNIIKTSPTRLVNMVISPAFSEALF